MLPRSPYFLLLLTVFAGGGCRGGNEPVPLRYVGGEACRSCHETEYLRWQESHHDLAMEPATEETVLGDFDDATFRYGSVVSRFYRRDSTFFVKTDGPDGRLAEFEIAYTFGVVPLQQYLVAFPDGRLQALPLAWNSRPASEGGQRWYHLYPDDIITHDDPLHWTKSYQNWNHMCAECHSTNLQKNYRPAEDRFETTWSDIDVSCEACHGPGSRHVALAKELREGEEPAAEFFESLTVRLRATDLGAWTIDPETGTARRDSSRLSPEIDICAPCHSRRSTVSQHIVPGRPFLETHRPSLLEEGLYFADGQILDEVYVYGSFLQSRMYAVGVTCGNCHDSHGLQVLAEGNALCATCHLATKYDRREHHFHDPDSTGGQCVACHMPSRVYMGVDARRDHSMRVPRPDLAEAIGVPNACNDCHADRSPSWAVDYVKRWYRGSDDTPHWAITMAGGRHRDPNYLPALISMSADTLLPGIVRATAVRRIGEYPASASIPAIERAARDEDPLVRLASAQAASQRAEDVRLRLAIPLLYDSLRSIRTEAVQVLAAAGPAAVPAAHRTAFDRAMAELRESLDLHADRPESRVSSALIDAAAGRYAEAERSLRGAMTLDPSAEVAYVNLADVLRLQGRDAEGERILRSGLEMNPGSAAIRHSLGLLLVRAGRREEALDELGRAAELAPESPRFAYTFAVGVHSAGDPERAVAILDAALGSHPYDPDLLTALATMNLDLGRRDRALVYGRRLAEVMPHDEAVSGFVRSLEIR